MARFARVLRFIARSGKRIAITIGGFALILVGAVLSVPGVPGPGFLLIIGGLAVLGTEYAWARRTLDRARERARRATQLVRRKSRRAAEPEPGEGPGSDP
jgi:hypothetical protein